MTRSRFLLSLLGALFVGLWLPGFGSVHGQPAPAPPAAAPTPAPPADEPPAAATDGVETPWGEGVSTADRERARALFDQGNALNDDSLFVEAAERYRQALAHWQHPAIQLNLAKTLLHLQRLVEAFHLLRAATRYGPDPHDTPDEYRWALERLARIERGLVVVEVLCSQPGVEVSLDGERLFYSPGVVRRHLLPGEHTLVASKPGHLTESKTVELAAGAEMRVLFALPAIEDTTVDRRRWPRWQPWAVLGGAAAIGAAGAVLRWRAEVDFDRYDRAFSLACQDGCPDDQVSDSIAAMRGRAVWENRAAMGAFAAAGLGLLAGTAMLVLNQPRSYRVSASGVFVAGSVTERDAVLRLSWRF